MSDTLIIVIAVIAVLLVGLFVFRAKAGAKPESIDADEGTGMSDGFADATEELFGDMIGVDTHPDHPDDLVRIKGLGPKMAEELNGMGIGRYAQIAALSDADIDKIANSTNRPNFAARIKRDRWVEQAALLARGDTEAFEEKFGKIG